MYAGHFAIALGIASTRPRLPALPVLLGVGVLDILYGWFAITGISQTMPNLASGPYLFFDLVFIDWDHSLLMALLWSSLWGALFWRRPPLAVAAACAVFSHFVADVPMHNMDLAIYPHSATHWGLGLWGKLGTGAWLLEGLFCAAVLGDAWRRYRQSGISLRWPVLLTASMFFSMSPWTSPMRFIAASGMPAPHLLHGVLVVLGFVLPALALHALLRHAARAPAPARCLAN